MFKRSIFSALILGSLSLSALAAQPNWNYVQGGYASLDVNDDEDDFSPTGFTLEGVVEFNENVFGRADYMRASDDVGGIDIDFDMTSLVIGYKTPLAANTDLYVAGGYERLGAEVSGYGESGSDSAGGYGVYVGARSMLTDEFEIFGEAGYIKVSDYDVSDASFEAGATYYFSPNFGFGASYRTFDDFNILSANIRYAF